MIAAAVVGVILTAVEIFVSPLSSAARDAGEDGDAVSWSVAPSDATGPDGRSWMELALEPGGFAEEYLAIHNLSDSNVTFRLDAQDGYLTDKGRFNMLPSGSESIDAGTWIEVAEAVSVEAGAVAVVPFTVKVPANATPGDHAAGIAASVQSLGAGTDGTELVVESRVGFRVMARVAGELAPAIELDRLDAAYRLDWNPFSAGSMDVAYVVRNTGNTRVRFTPQVNVAGNPIDGAPDGAVEMLPGDERTFRASAGGIWPSGFPPIEVSVKPETIVPDGFDDVPTSAGIRKSVLVPAMPWPQLLVLSGFAFLAFSYLRANRLRRKKLEVLIDAAREEGIRIALDSPPGAVARARAPRVGETTPADTSARDWQDPA